MINVFIFLCHNRKMWSRQRRLEITRALAVALAVVVQEAALAAVVQVAALAVAVVVQVAALASIVVVQAAERRIINAPINKIKIT
jgi:hypothetical protein